MAGTKKTDSNCAIKLVNALMVDPFKVVVQAEAEAGAADPKDTNVYICVDMGESGIIYIRKPGQGEPVRVQL